MGKESLERLLTAISYPDRAGVDGSRAVLVVDEEEIVVEEKDRYLRFTLTLDVGESEFGAFAGYVPGRIYKEDATLAIGTDGKVFLWQDVAAGADERTLRQAFESFLASCDWWRARADSGLVNSEVHFQDVVIMP